MSGSLISDVYWYFMGLNNELCINSSDSFPLFECDGGEEIR